jgi:hypothetical protein
MEWQEGICLVSYHFSIMMKSFRRDLKSWDMQWHIMFDVLDGVCEWYFDRGYSWGACESYVITDFMSNKIGVEGKCVVSWNVLRWTFSGVLTKEKKKSSEARYMYLLFAIALGLLERCYPVSYIRLYITYEWAIRAGVKAYFVFLCHVWIEVS